MYVPTKIFFTKGVGRHKDYLQSFELALRDAKIEKCNLVTVSSIYPAGCKRVPPEDGLSMLQAGQITFAVMARNATNEPNRLIAASLGVATPAGHAADQALPGPAEALHRASPFSAKNRAMTSVVWRHWRAFAGPALLAFDALEDLFAMDGNVLWRIDAYAHLIALDAEDRDAHGVADHQGFADATRQNQHVGCAPSNSEFICVFLTDGYASSSGLDSRGRNSP